MSRETESESDGADGTGADAQEPSPRPLYWWHVPERPGVGRDMLVFAGVWFVTLFALAVIIGAIIAVTG